MLLLNKLVILNFLDHYSIAVRSHTKNIGKIRGAASEIFCLWIERIKILSKLLGHADVNITYNVYVHLFGDGFDEMYEALVRKIEPTSHSRL